MTISSKSNAPAGAWLRRIFWALRGKRADAAEFSGSGDYWEQRYAAGGNSGAGSYRELAEFKAEIINRFVAENDVQTVIEFGCGDGNQLSLATYPAYLGLDVSTTAIEQCREKFAGDASCRFELMQDYDGESADLALSLDVIYHLVEDDVYEDYMRRLFAGGERFVIVYSSNTDDNPKILSPHVRHRCFTDWVRKNASAWVLRETIPNRYPQKGLLGSGSFADFYIFGRQ